MWTLEPWKHLIPDDVRATLESCGSGAKLPDLIALGQQIGKTPYSHDGTAMYWAHRILGPAYPMETKDAYDWRQMDACPEPMCEACQEVRATFPMGPPSPLPVTRVW